MRFRSIAIGAALASGLLASCATQVARDEGTDALRAGFASPPPSATPRTWWHWLNGNISREGIAADLAWMHRIGIGGVQVFDADLGTPVIVPHRVAYMSDEWRDDFAFAVRTADQYGMEVTIAGSPGWSETGGPWVLTQDGMKKLVWSETRVAPHGHFAGFLPRPPSETGPYQTLAPFNPLGGGDAHVDLPNYYGDVAVLAFPVSGREFAPRRVSVSTGGVANASRLYDDDLRSEVQVRSSAPDAPMVLTYEYDNAVEIRSATLFMPRIIAPFSGPRYLPRLEAEVDGAWRKIADVPLTRVPTTVGFTPVTARRFRLVLADNPAQGAGLEAPAPGAIVINPFVTGGADTISIAELTLSNEARVNLGEIRAGFAVVPDYAGLAPIAPAGVASVARNEVINLTSRMSADGRLDWTAPDAREWRIVRYGYSLTGTTNHPASADATGLEVDKYDAPAVRRYLDAYLATYRRALGPDLIGARGLQALLTDSIEVDPANWTPDMIAQFQHLRGYDPTTFLPALSGTIVSSAAETEAFLYDWRMTLEDLLASQHYATVAQFAHDNHLRVYGEALEDVRPVLGDDIAMRSYADTPMSALWAFQRGERARPTLVGDMRGAASVADFYGRPFVAAESMTTSFSPWAFAPSDLKRLVDLEFVSGVNRIVVHTSVHQPRDDFQPGLSLAIFGQYFTRHETWAEMAGPWIQYISRSSYMLQQGRTVTDLAVFAGDDTPVTVLFAQGGDRALPRGYGYDFVNAEGIEHGLRVRDGALRSEAGATYRALYIMPGARMRTATLQQIASLVAAGAKIVGPAPAWAPSQTGRRDAFDALVARLWPTTPPVEVSAELAAANITPDFQGDSDVQFLHRRIDDAEVYFLTNRANEERRFDGVFRVSGKAPEIWRAVDGSVTPASYAMERATTRVPLTLAPEEAVFVVFRDGTHRHAETIAPQAERDLGAVDGPWSVAFQPNRGAPERIELPVLTPLNENAAPGVKYFSGVATYSQAYTPPSGMVGRDDVWLDLGRVGDVAHVRVNGQDAGITWIAPYRVNVGRLLQEGANTIEVDVADLWVNRLIGDAQPGATQIAHVVAPTYQPNAPLRPSGLMGPVHLVEVH